MPEDEVANAPACAGRWRRGRRRARSGPCGRGGRGSRRSCPLQAPRARSAGAGAACRTAELPARRRRAVAVRPSSFAPPFEHALAPGLARLRREYKCVLASPSSTDGVVRLEVSVPIRALREGAYREATRDAAVTKWCRSRTLDEVTRSKCECHGAIIVAVAVVIQPEYAWTRFTQAHVPELIEENKRRSAERGRDRRSGRRHDPRRTAGSLGEGGRRIVTQSHMF
jgi:hypothetical protein